MRFYIATGLENHAAHNDVRDRLTAMGHQITYDWTQHGAVWSHGVDKIREVAEAERQGVESAEFVVVLLPGGRGTHVELGVALTCRKPVIIWAADDSKFGAVPETCAFYHDPIVRTISGPLPIIEIEREYAERVDREIGIHRRYLEKLEALRSSLRFGEVSG